MRKAGPGRHLYFLDDHLLGNPRFASMLFDGMKGMGRVWQAAATVNSVLKPTLLGQAAAAGLRSLFVGIENLDENNLRNHAKVQNLGRDYNAAIRRIHNAGVMVNGSFVFGMDEDTPDVFDKTVEWIVSQGIETATFHVMTPYPGTGLYDRIERLWNLLIRTRHVASALPILETVLTQFGKLTPDRSRVDVDVPGDIRTRFSTARRKAGT